MPAASSLLPELEEVVQHGSIERRTHALLRVAALFVATARNLKKEHIDLFDAVLCRLIDEIDTGSRTELATQLAGIDNAPSRTVGLLANDDEPAVAQPLLLRSRQLDEADLISLARSKSHAHLLALASRRGLSESVTDVLLARGSRDVLNALARNATALFSQSGLAALLEAAAADSSLADKLLLRSDLPRPSLQKLLAQFSRASKERLLATAKPELQEEIRQALGSDDKALPSAAAARDYTAAEARIRQMRQSGTLYEAAVLEFASSFEYEETVAALASLCAVPTTVAARILGSERTDPVLILCKSVGWGWPTARAIIGLLPDASAMPEQALDATYVNFERLSPTTAQRVLRFWQVHHLDSVSA
jgi:uncharacterized protein (DUF2336 family)